MHVSRDTHAVFFRLAPGDALPDALFARLREAGVATGTLRGHGVLEHVELRTFAPQTRSLGPARAIAGAVHAIAVEGAIGLSDGAPQAALRAVLSRETDAGVETLSGVLVAARVIAFEVSVISAQDLALPLAHDARAGVAMLGDGRAPSPSPSPSPSPAHAPSPSPPAAWAEAIATSQAQSPLRASAPAGPALPARPPQRPVPDDDGEQIFPEAGDEVQHFAFGTCEVLRSDGDRLHLKVGKDGRIREIALEMLKVALVGDPDERPRKFKLDRRL
jgi:predicted DNA-binding protein with PD1-like motif